MEKKRSPLNMVQVMRMKKEWNNKTLQEWADEYNVSCQDIMEIMELANKVTSDSVKSTKVSKKELKDILKK